MTEITSVLGLPLEKQKELAARRGMSHGEWVEHTKKSLAESDEFLRKLLNNKLEEPRMTPEQIANFQSKIDSGNPPSKSV